MTSFNTTLTPLVCKAIAGHILLVLLFISSYQIAFRDLLSMLSVCASSGITDTHSQREVEQNRTAKIKTLHYKHGEKKITETQGKKEDTKDKARLDEALILKCLFQPKPFCDSVKGASIQ